ncbi:MAG: adenosylcobalamin-dependent ribonucleoside-diphosphate reductase [Anaeromyxobacter sp.]|nr:adenosylcobalamin-dependent ribonucleoside-diphosphate reductase [Anaeromyxobacter sp.]
MVALSENARQVLARRYLLRDEAGQPLETPAGLFHRVAEAVARAEAPRQRGRWTEAFEARLAALEFLPNSPTLMNAGRPHGQLAACFVLPVEDDLAAIFDALKWAALIHQSGGGTGFSFSRLRPRGDLVRTTHGVASGPLSFIRVFDGATEIIKQGGVRRGANMAVLHAAHPDILEFVDAKRGPGLGNFNVSVAAPDALFEAAAGGREWPLLHPATGGVVRRMPARALLERIASAAWSGGEPGLVFLDRVEAGNPTPDLGRFEAVNPCGEQPLLPFEACTLGSVNLARFEAGGQVDWDGLAGCVRDGVRFLDDVLEVNTWPLPQVAAISARNRKIGLGVMGWADLLIRLGIPYDAPEALDLAAGVMGFVRREAHQESQRLAGERGPFPGFPTSALAAAGGRPRRHATVTTLAPTGTLALIAGCSSGIEPLFALAYVRHALDGAELPEEHPALAAALEAAGAAAALPAVRAAGRARGVAGVPEPVARRFATAHDVAPEAHVRMQAAFQRFVDNGVSKTVNLPSQATVDEVARCFQLAFELGCKGLTVYRDGSRDQQVLVSGAAAERCPACQGPLSRSGGCATCARCGYGSCETAE